MPSIPSVWLLPARPLRVPLHPRFSGSCKSAGPVPHTVWSVFCSQTPCILSQRGICEKQAPALRKMRASQGYVWPLQQSPTAIHTPDTRWKGCGLPKPEFLGHFAGGFPYNHHHLGWPTSSLVAIICPDDSCRQNFANTGWCCLLIFSSWKTQNTKRKTSIHSLEMDVLIMFVQAKYNLIIFEDLEFRSCVLEHPEPSVDGLKHRRIVRTLNASDPKRTHQPRNTVVTYDRGTVSFPSNPTSAGQRLTTQVHWWNFHSQLFSIGLPKFS